ncbi:MAG TPA: hypothetical protein VKB12_15215 [Pyrinomonadaceae bacterium]|nr:hypothetical protein [Pyrinomonadaceae bacterium]
MREFTKSMMSYTWAQSLFGVQQLLNLFSSTRGRQQNPVTEGFNGVAGCAKEQMGEALRATFRAGDNIQRAMVDVMFGALTLGSSGCGGRCGDRRDGAAADAGRKEGRGYERQAADAGQQTADTFRQGMNVMGRAADVIGAAVGGAASEWSGGGDRMRYEPTGWGPVPPPDDAAKYAPGRGNAVTPDEVS